MESILTKFNRDGYIAPIRIFSEKEVSNYCKLLYSTLIEKLNDPEVSDKYVWQLHLLEPWLAGLVREDQILNAVQEILGPNILAWNSTFIIKHPFDQSYTSWHQDRTFWGLQPARAVTVWIAFTRSYRKNGCVLMMPGTHREGQIDHANRYSEGNMLSRGQEIDLKVGSNKAVAMELQPGEMSLHDISVVHSSEPNNSEDIRIGYNITYIAPDVRQIRGPDTAYLVRGQDDHGNYFLAPTPRDSESKETQAVYAEAVSHREDVLANDLATT
jgi:chlorinating enzyme